MEVAKTDNPTKEQIEEIHKVFIEKLVEIFEKHKHKFIKNPENTFIEFV